MLESGYMGADCTIQKPGLPRKHRAYGFSTYRLLEGWMTQLTYSERLRCNRHTSVCDGISTDCWISSSQKATGDTEEDHLNL
jgi:hypothetical protein